MTFPATVDSALQQTIDDWYNSRIVCDDDAFNRMFNRVLNRDMPQYQQLLRIEPGKADYDWMVEEYLELQRTHESTDSQETSGTTSVTHGGTVTESGNSTTTKTGTDKVDTASGTKHTGTVGVESSGKSSDTTTNTGTVTDSGKSSNTQTRNLASTDDTTDTTTYGHQVSGSNNNTKSGSETHTHTQSAIDNYDEDSGTDTTIQHRNYSVTTDNTPGVTETTSTLAKQGTKTNTGELQKVNPMSPSYANATAGSGDGITSGSGIPVMDWTAPSSQAQNVTTTEPLGTDPDTVQITRTGSDKTVTTTQDDTAGSTSALEHGAKKAYSRNETDTDTYNNVADNATTSETHSGEDKVVRASTGSDTGTIKDEGATGNTRTLNTTDTQTGETSGTQTTTHNTSDDTTGTQTTTHDTSDATISGRTTTNDLTDSGTSSGTVSSSHNDTEREVHTGRHGEPAEILARAAAYIKGSSAWAWLSSRLEVCFLGVYEV